MSLIPTQVNQNVAVCLSPPVPGRSITEFLLLDGLLVGRRLGSTADITRAYALVSAAYPDVTGPRWLRVARQCIRTRPDRGGLFALQTKRNTMLGLFRYVVDDSLSGGNGSTLRLHDVITAQLPGDASLSALMSCVRSLAARLGCPGVVLDIPCFGFSGSTDDVGPKHLADNAMMALQAAGYQRVAVSLAQRVDA